MCSREWLERPTTTARKSGGCWISEPNYSISYVSLSVMKPLPSARRVQRKVCVCSLISLDLCRSRLAQYRERKLVPQIGRCFGRTSMAYQKRASSNSASGLGLQTVRPENHEDWEPYKEIIAQLYTEVRLKDVMREMQRSYGFKAT